MGRFALAIAVFAVIAWGQEASAQGLPHVFNNGDVIYADEVNENFNFLLALHGTPRNVRANGTILGQTFNIPGLIGSVYVLLPQKSGVSGFSVDSAGKISPSISYSAYFVSADCSGTPYFGYQAISGSFKFRPAMTTLIDINGVLYYIPVTSTVYSFTAFSYRLLGFSTCSAVGGGVAVTAFAVQLNNSAVTGVSQYPFPTPITIDGVETLQVINQ